MAARAARWLCRRILTVLCCMLLLQLGTSVQSNQLVDCSPIHGSCAHCTNIQKLQGYYCQGIMTCSGSVLDRFCGCASPNCTVSSTDCKPSTLVNGTCVSPYTGMHSPEHCSGPDACNPACSDPQGCSDNPTDPKCQFDCGCGEHACECSVQCLVPN